MKEKFLFEEKIVPTRIRSEFEIRYNNLIAQQYGAKREKMAKIKNKFHVL
jgi:hypothetical protein